MPNKWRNACRDDYPLDPDLRNELTNWEMARFDLDDVERTYTQHGALSKATAIALYLHDLKRRGLFGNDPDPIANTQEAKAAWRLVADGFELTKHFELPVNGGSMHVDLTAFVADPHAPAYADGDAEWKAFLFQDVTLPSSEPTHMLLIDTSDFLVRPPKSFFFPGLRCNKLERLCSLPGDLGRVEERQAELIDERVDDFETNNIEFFVAGHHDWQSLSSIAAENLAKAINSDHFITYLSGHTHDPTATGGFGSTEQWEINMASITDWPMQYAKIEYWRAMDNRVRSTDLTVTVKRAYDSPTCSFLADPRHDSARELSYYGKEYQIRIRNQYAAFFRYLSTSTPADLDTDAAIWRTELSRHDAMNAPLQELFAFDRVYLRPIRSIRDIETNCAAWASLQEREIRVGRWKEAITRAKQAVSTVLNRHLKRLYVHKDPIDHGISLDENAPTSFRVHHDGR